MSAPIQCPSVSDGATFFHEPCTSGACHWWGGRCTARDTVPLGRLKKKLSCPLATKCRWGLEAPDGLCPPMTYGTLCEHQGGDFNTFDFEEATRP
jgi:hypothetical protein